MVNLFSPSQKKTHTKESTLDAFREKKEATQNKMTQEMNKLQKMVIGTFIFIVKFKSKSNDNNIKKFIKKTL